MTKRFKLDISGVQVPANINDAYFKRPVAKAAKGEEAFFADNSSVQVTAERKADQKAVDAALLKVVKSTPLMKAYLNAKFSLKQGQFPHQMKF